jgi:hypothetical protein
MGTSAEEVFSLTDVYGEVTIVNKILQYLGLCLELKAGNDPFSPTPVVTEELGFSGHK